MKITSTAPVTELPSLPGRGYGDGYDWMGEVHDETPWVVIPSWGRDGWDMGSWPYVQILTCVRVVPEPDRQPKTDPVCIYCRQRVRLLDGQVWASEDAGADCPALANPLPPVEWHPNHKPIRRSKVYGAASYCEGDIERYAFETHEQRIDALDALAQFYWRLSCDYTEDGMVPIGPLAAKWFGAFSFDRADNEREEPLIVVQERSP